MTRKKSGAPMGIERGLGQSLTREAGKGGYAYPEPRSQSGTSTGHVAEPENLVLGHLRAIRADLADHGQRLGRIETRLSAIEQTLGGLYAIGGSDREAIQALARRVDRIERRLELTD